MGLTRAIAVLLIAGGGLGLLYGGFTYTRETRTAHLGPVVLQVKDRQTLHVPVLVSAAAVALGVILLLGLRNK